jgi:hypothetical protein
VVAPAIRRPLLAWIVVATELQHHRSDLQSFEYLVLANEGREEETTSFD